MEHLRSYFALVSNSADGDIAVFHLDGSTGRMTLVERCPTGEVTMPMTLTADEQFVYAVTRGSVPELKKFSIDSHSGHLTHFQSAGINASLAYLSIDRAGRYLFGASYGEHLLNVYSVDCIDASEGTPLQSISGIEHAHAAIVSTDDRFVYATSLGWDTVVCLEIRSDNPGAPLVPFDHVALDKGFGPRHLRFSRSGEFLYVLSEFRATVAFFVAIAKVGVSVCKACRHVRHCSQTWMTAGRGLASQTRFARIQRHFYPWSGQLIFRSDPMADLSMFRNGHRAGCLSSESPPTGRRSNTPDASARKRNHEKLQNRSDRGVSRRFRREVLPVIRVRH